MLCSQKGVPEALRTGGGQGKALVLVTIHRQTCKGRFVSPPAQGNLPLMQLSLQASCPGGG